MRTYIDRAMLGALLVCAALGLGLGRTAQAAAPSEAMRCVGCHGPDGVSQNPNVPTIAGMSEFYLEGELDAYRMSHRPCAKMKGTSMCAIARMLSPAEIKGVSTYFAAQQFVPATQSTSAAQVARGRTIYQTDCQICHSHGGSSASDDAGILAGQWIPYLLTQLQDYHAGKRPEPMAMKPMIAKQSAADLQALAQFFGSGGR